MKPPRPKPHILQSVVPLTEGVTHEAKCGATVTKAQWVKLEEGQLLPGTIADLKALGKICPACLEKYESEIELHYTILAVSGELLK